MIFLIEIAVFWRTRTSQDTLSTQADLIIRIKHKNNAPQRDASPPILSYAANVNFSLTKLNSEAMLNSPIPRYAEKSKKLIRIDRAYCRIGVIQEYRLQMLSGHGARAGGQEVPAASDKFTYPKVCREIIKADSDMSGILSYRCNSRISPPDAIWARSPCRQYWKITYPKVCREITKAGLDTQCKPLDRSTQKTLAPRTSWAGSSCSRW